MAYRAAEQQGTKLRIPREVNIAGQAVRMLNYGDPDCGMRVKHLFDGRFS